MKKTSRLYAVTMGASALGCVQAVFDEAGRHRRRFGKERKETSIQNFAG
jgi:hypothetical protein